MLDDDDEISLNNNNNSAKEAFIEEFGVYLELIYLYLQSPFGNSLKYNDIFDLEAHQFLFLCEYLIQKQKIEAKNNK